MSEDLVIVKIPTRTISKMRAGSEQKKEANRADVVINDEGFIIREPKGLGMRKAKPSEIRAAKTL